MAIRDPTPAPNAPVGVVEPPPPAPPAAGPARPAGARRRRRRRRPPVRAADQRRRLPAQTRKPVYPSISKRLGEQGA